MMGMDDLRDFTHHTGERVIKILPCLLKSSINSLIAFPINFIDMTEKHAYLLERKRPGVCGPSIPLFG